MNDQLAEKAELTIYQPTKDCPLTQRDLMVWSYLFWQSAYKDKPNFKNPNFRKVSAKTGILPAAVSDICDNLKSFGLIGEDGIATLPDHHRDMFRESRSRGDHLTQRLAFQKTWVRNLEIRNPLGITSIYLYSFLRNKFATGFVPSGGWHKQYLATCLHCKADTITAGLAKLQDVGMIVHQASPFSVQMYENLTAEQLSYFADARPYREAAEEETGVFGFLPSPVAQNANKDYNLASVEQRTYLSLKISQLLGGQHANFVEKVVNKTRELPKNEWDKCAQDFAERITALQSETRVSDRPLPDGCGPIVESIA